MGIASQDIDGDGRPEVFLTNQADNMLQTLVDGAQGPDYTDISRKMGTTATHPYAGGDTRNSTAWHAEFQDVNNDGFMDLFVTKGNVEAMEEFAAKDPPNLLIGQPDHTFVEGAQDAGIVDFARGRGAAVVDFNLDGLLDIVEVARRENVRLWRGVGAGTAEAPAPMGHWAAVRLQQPGAEPRRHRRLDQRQDRRAGHRPRADRRRRPRGRPAWLDALRSRPVADGRGPGPVAGRRGRSLAVPAGRRLRDHRTRRRRRATMDAGRRLSVGRPGPGSREWQRWIARGWRPSTCPTSACPPPCLLCRQRRTPPASKRLA